MKKGMFLRFFLAIQIVLGDVSRSDSGRIFFFDFFIFRSTWKPENRFSLKKSANVTLIIIQKNKKASRDTWCIV